MAAGRQGPTVRIQHYFKESEVISAYRGIHTGLAAEQIKCSPEPVRQIMRSHGQLARQPPTVANALKTPFQPDRA